MEGKDRYCYGFESEGCFLGALKRGAGGGETSSIVVITPNVMFETVCHENGKGTGRNLAWSKSTHHDAASRSRTSQ